jgi:hypothetical protein
VILLVGLLTWQLRAQTTQSSTSSPVDALTAVVDPPAQTSRTTQLAVVAAGPHERIWSTGDAASGRRVVELATGMNFWHGQSWTLSDPSFAVTAKGFAAERLQHKVRLSADLYTIGAVTVVTPDGITLSSTPLGIGLYDAASGRSALIALTTNCLGVLINDRQVAYQDAFAGICADVVYTIDAGSFRQDVVITGRLDPADYGFPTNTTRLQIFTEFYNAPEPDRLRRPLRVEKDDAVRRQMASPDLVDEVLGFGEFVIGTGKAFTAPSASQTNGVEGVVAKEFKTTGGRTFLTESVEFQALNSGLETLPVCVEQTASAAIIRRGQPQYASIPPSPVAGGQAAPSPVRGAANRVAKVETARPAGVVIDYVATLGNMSTAFTFQGDTTYLVSAVVSLNGPVTIEGGAVIKFKVGTSVQINNSLTCKSASYRPAIFTCVDDNTVGETMNGVSGSGYTGTIATGGYANPALLVAYPYSSVTLLNLRFCYAQEAIRITGPAGYVNATVQHSQFVNCVRGIELMGTGCGCGSPVSCGLSVTVNNCLMAGVQSPLLGTTSGAYYYVNLYQCTIDGSTLPATVLCTGPGTGTTLYVNSYNSILANFTTLSSGNVSPSGYYNGFYNCTQFGNNVVSPSVTPPFQSQGAGNYYLAAGVNFKNGGVTTYISSSLLNDLKLRTTDPPVPITTPISTATSWYPGLRDTDVPDLGYHYDALDYILNNVALSATLTLTNGVAVGVQNTYGLDLQTGARLASEGTPLKMNHVASLANVQEQPIATGGSTFMKLNTSFAAAHLDFRFTDVSVGQGTLGTPLDTGGTAGNNPFDGLCFRDCWLHDAALILYPQTASAVTAGFTNNIIERCKLTIGHTSTSTNTPFSVYFYNNLFLGDPNSATPGTPPALSLIYDSGTSNPGWQVHDNLFDKATQTLTGNLTASVSPSNDGFTTGTTHGIVGASDQTGVAVTYQVGPLGNYYLPTTATQLINQGSRSASAAGLYHYTVRVDQAKEATAAAVSIGYHYVALNASGQPVDTDTDLLPDYVEDRNGNGTKDTTETDWLNADTDNDGFTDYQEIWIFNSDPLDAYSLNRRANGGARFTDCQYLCTAPVPGGNYVAGDTATTLTETYNPSSGTFHLVLSGPPSCPTCTPTCSPPWDIYFSWFLPNQLVPWTLYYRGTPGSPGVPAQTVFDVPFPGGTSGFFVAGSGCDTDGDGLTDGYEALVSHTKPGMADTDGDGMPDGWEVANGLNPNDAPGFSDRDTDLNGDGISNYQHYLDGTNPMGNVEPPGACSRRTGLVISEIMYAPTGGDPYEFIEIYNSQPVTENISGYGLYGTGTTPLQYTFANPTEIGPGAYLVIANTPANIQSSYGNVFGPYSGNLPDIGGTITLTNRLGSMLLEAKYSPSAPYPASAAGGGHSLVLARPSYGEGNSAAWAASDLIGGSPGKADVRTAELLRPIVINEVLVNASDPNNNFFELYNHRTTAATLDNYRLTFKPSGSQITCEYSFPGGTTIPARGFAAVWQGGTGRPTLGFPSGFITASGGTLYFKNPSGTRILDSIIVGPQDSGLSVGRFGDGAPGLQELTTPTPGAGNSTFNIRNIVINEIMFNPNTGDKYQYIELFNKGGDQVLTGWQLSGDIAFTFSGGTIPANGYFVIAHDVNSLLDGRYGTQLTGQNTVGSYNPELPHKGGRIILQNSQGVVIDDVTYNKGGKWGQWSDGGGSSLELIDARSDNRQPSNWGDSDETAKATWIQITKSDTCTKGDGMNIDYLEIILTDAGECLIDDVHVLDPSMVDHVATGNQGFETDTGLKFEGTHEFSAVETPAIPYSGKALHLRASGRGDYLANRIRIPLTAITVPPNPPAGTFTISGRFRWLRGQPEVVMRLSGNYLEEDGTLNLNPVLNPLPTNLGTPGAINSITPASNPNTGPAIYDVSHSPVLPAANHAVVVTARFHDPDGISSPTLNYRVDPATTFTAVTMKDDGTGGDVVAGDGLYSATIPGQGVGKLVAFNITVADSPVSPRTSVSTRFPVAQVMYPADPTWEQRQCLVRFGEPAPPGGLGTYRFWITQATFNKWAARGTTANQFHNGAFDATFVYGSSNAARAVYNAGALWSASAHTSSGFDTPTGNQCGYSVKFPPDDLLLGDTEVNLDHDGENHEQICYWIAGQMGIPAIYRRSINLYVNGMQRLADSGTISAFDDTQKPNATVIKGFYPASANGELFKIEVWWQNRSLPVTTFVGATLVHHRKAHYRWTWEKRADPKNSASDYDSFTGLVEALNPALNVITTPANVYAGQIWACVDEGLIRALAFQHLVGDSDAYSVGPPSESPAAGHNMYAYKPPKGKWTMIPYDLDYGLAYAGVQPMLNDGSFKQATDDTTLDQTATPPGIMAVPSVQRAYWRAVQTAVNGPLNANGTANRLMTEQYNGLLENGAIITGTGPSDIIYFNGQVSQITASTPNSALTQLNAAVGAFTWAISSAPGTTTQNPFQLKGTAPVSVKTIKVNDVEYPVSWDTLSSWSIWVPIMTQTATVLTAKGYDAVGAQVGSASITVTYSPTGTAYTPGTDPVINEWVTKDNPNLANMMTDPADGNPQAWIEIYNPANSLLDVSGYVLRRVGSPDYIFPGVTTIRPGGFLLVWGDAETTKQEGMFGPNGDLHASFVLNDNVTIELYTPGASRMVDSVNIGASTSNKSTGRLPDGMQPTTTIQVLTPSPRVPNTP